MLPGNVGNLPIVLIQSICSNKQTPFAKLLPGGQVRPLSSICELAFFASMSCEWLKIQKQILQGFYRKEVQHKVANDLQQSSYVHEDDCVLSGGSDKSVEIMLLRGPFVLPV